MELDEPLEGLAIDLAARMHRRNQCDDAASYHSVRLRTKIQTEMVSWPVEALQAEV
jgi:hypothetical protein